MTMVDAAEPTGQEPGWLPGGDLSVLDFPDIKSRLLAMLQGEDKKIELDFSQVNSIDVSIVQVLYSFHLSCIRSGKLLAIRNPSAAFVTRMDQIGMPFPWGNE